MDPVDISALFLGPKSENREYLSETLQFLIDEHVHWRRDFHPDDPPVIDFRQRRSEGHEATLERTSRVLDELSSRLKATSMPWFSPRYLGHMNADTLLAANLAYVATVLYNPNNVAYEASPATTEMELEVGRQFAALFGYPPEQSWGHVTADGTVANYEALWIARNLQSVPRAVAAVEPELVADLDEWELANVPPERTLDLLDRVEEADSLDGVRERTAGSEGVRSGETGKILVPQSAHYSLSKAADVLGIGRDNLVEVAVDEDFRLDVDALRETIDGFAADNVPILAVVPVLGSTEEGAVDPLDEVVAMREAYEERGVSFYLHADAAYGGYVRAIFRDEDGRFMGFERAREALRERTALGENTDWPPRAVYDAYAALDRADSITIDPHKMGYVPYAAGGLVVRDRRARDVISYFAPYAIEEGENLLGSYILEGSKPGATVAAVWAANRVVPLSIDGYGQLVGQAIEGADRFFASLASLDGFDADGREVLVAPVTDPDTNIVNFAFNAADNSDLDRMNRLNREIYDRCSYRTGPVYEKDFVTSKTTLSAETYGDAPSKFVSSLGVPADAWDDVGEVTVLRSCVLTPFLAHRTTYREYWEAFLDAMRDVLTDVLREDAR